VLVIRTDAIGNQKWMKTFAHVHRDSDGYALLGYVEIDEKNWDAYVVEVSKDLEPGRSKKFGSAGMDTAA